MKALVIDDHPVFVTALEALVKQLKPGLQVDTASTAEAALAQLDWFSGYRFMLLDLYMPGLDGFTLLRILDQRRIVTPVIIVSSNEEPEVIRAAIAAGAVGYIPKSHSAEWMRAAIEQVLAGDLYLPEALGDPLALSGPPAPGDRPLIPGRCAHLGISPRTCQVLCGMASGRTNREIAEDLHMSVHTVKAHIARLFERLHTSNRMEAVMEAIRLGLIDQ